MLFIMGVVAVGFAQRYLGWGDGIWLLFWALVVVEIGAAFIGSRN